jgi:hypothetical protein
MILSLETEEYTGTLPWLTPEVHSEKDAEAMIQLYEKEKRFVVVIRCVGTRLVLFQLACHCSPSLSSFVVLEHADLGLRYGGGVCCHQCGGRVHGWTLIWA